MFGTSIVGDNDAQTNTQRSARSFLRSNDATNVLIYGSSFSAPTDVTKGLVPSKKTEPTPLPKFRREKMHKPD